MMENKTHFIVSVGTSIMSNYEKNNKGPKLEDTIQEPTNVLKNDVFGKIINCFHKPCMFFNNGYEVIKRQLNDKCKGAEEKSISTTINAKGNHQGSTLCFHLIVTNTKECKFCASFLGKEVLCNINNGNDVQIDYYIPDGLGKADDNDFSEKGLPNLLSCLAYILDSVKNGDEAFIIPTGGYKAIIPYLTIASILYNKPAYYIYEDSTKLIELPAPPLSVNTPLLRSALVLLENIDGVEKNKAKPYYEALSEPFQKLVYLKVNTYSYTAFGIKLKAMFKSQIKSPLVTLATGSSLIDKLNGYKETFENMLKLGETIWIGDKAQEMAEHARNHHSNLFAYSELLLLPMLNNHLGLTPEDLFLLLGAIYLHDCGHTRTELTIDGNSIPLLPTEIRNFHNLLGYQRMKDNDFKDTLERQGLDLNSNILDSIATLSVYHRKKMPLLNNGNVYKGPGSNNEHNSLCNKTVTLNNNDINGNRLVLLASLFRIIDGMDKQVGRAGEAVEIAMKAEAVLSDLEPLWNRAKRLGEALNSLSPCTKKKTDEIYNKIISKYGEQESTGSNNSKNNDKCEGWMCNRCPTKSQEQEQESTTYQELKQELNGNAKACFSLAWEYLHARVQFFFKAIQPSYYYSDLLLGMPKVQHEDKNGKRHISIKYDENKEFCEYTKKIEAIWGKIKEWIMRNTENGEPEKELFNKLNLTDAEKVVCGIRDEYCNKKNTEVAKILSDINITIEFQYGNKSTPCWNKTTEKA